MCTGGGRGSGEKRENRRKERRGREQAAIASTPAHRATSDDEKGKHCSGATTRRGREKDRDGEMREEEGLNRRRIWSSTPTPTSPSPATSAASERKEEEERGTAPLSATTTVRHHWLFNIRVPFLSIKVGSKTLSINFMHMG
ncbi:hypothetical protein U1Q18_041745 [Sarracenia purpurea var. burkii]